MIKLHWPAVLMAILLLLAIGCENPIGRAGHGDSVRSTTGADVDGETVATTSESADTGCVPLIAGQTLEIGTVCADKIDTTNDGTTDTLVLAYSTTGEWIVYETHFWIGRELEELPTTRSGNPIPGHFPYKSEHPEGTEFASFEIPYDDLKIDRSVMDEHFFVAAAHADVRRDSGDGSVQSEGSWATGERIVERGNWATYFELTIQCAQLSPGDARVVKRLLFGGAEGVHVSGDYAYVKIPGGLRIINVASPDDAFVVRDVSAPTGGGGYYKSVYASGDYAYLAGGAAGLHVISVNPPESAHIVKTIPTPGAASGVHVVDGYAYVADDAAGLTIIRLDPLGEAQDSITSVQTLARPRRVHVAGGYAYLATRGAAGGGLEIVDVDPPESAFLVRSISTGSASGVDVAGDYAYLANRNARLRVYDVGDPASTFEVANVYTGPGAWDVDVSAGYAYVAASSHLRIFNVFDPRSPVLVHTVANINAIEVHVEGAYAYVAGGNMGLVIVRLF